ncbi:MAG: glycosyltransferase family 39 protein [Anaerolineaceae bacterium]|nr:glycosyltransferase family 39 protein [Anaerolineaceae bacterium]
MPVLLLAALLAGRQLNTWAFSNDEASTMIAAGARNFGPLSPMEALQNLNERAPDQAFGWTLIMNLWGSLVGWSSLAARSLAWLTGLVALSLIYRAGRSLFTHEAGLVAILLLASSSYFASYLHVARTFTLVALLNTLFLWSYWRLVSGVHPTTRRPYVGLVLGGSGLLYAHYFAAVMVPAVGLYHLLLVRKDRRWTQVTLALMLIMLSALPEMQVLLTGAELNYLRYAIDSGNLMSGPETAIRLLYMLGNSLVSLPQRAGPAIVLLFLALLLLLLRIRPCKERSRTARFIGIVVLLFTLMMLGINEIMHMMLVDRMRYFMALWPPAALLGGIGLWRLGQVNRRLADWLLVFVFASGVALILRTDIYLSVDHYNPARLHLAEQALARLAGPEDLLLLDEKVLGFGPNASPVIRKYYTGVLHHPYLLLTAQSGFGQSASPFRNHARVWLLAYEANSAFEEKLNASMHNCRSPVRRKSAFLTLYAHNRADCR